MRDEGLYTEFMREHRWLSDHLVGRAEVRRFLQEIRVIATIDDLDATEAALEAKLANLCPEYPQLGRPEVGRVDDGGGEYRSVGDSLRIPTNRYWIKCRITGDVELLRYWPDKSDKELRSVHHELMETIGGYQNLAMADEGVAREYWRLQPTWRLATVDEDGPWALYTYFDLTRDEERALAAAGGLVRSVEDRCQRVEMIVEEIATQTRRYFEEDLPALARTILSQRREELSDRTELLRDLFVPAEWAAAPLEIEELAPEPSEEESSDPDQCQVAELMGEQLDAALDLPALSYRLSPKSFNDILRTIRTWADAVEQNPRGFGDLDEDSISDLLAATLNATVPHAGREVFSRSGRVDIHITADVLAQGTGPAEVFLCESKWASSEARVKEALEDQIFRYLTAHSTQAVLLALCRQQEFAAAENHVREWAARAKGFEATKTGPVAGWPHNSYFVDGKTVEVCVATVWIPPVTTRDGKRK